MKLFRTLSAIALGTAALPLPAQTTKSPTITWTKQVIDPKFRSEGVAVADVNKDGKNCDIIFNGRILV